MQTLKKITNNFKTDSVVQLVYSSHVRVYNSL